MKKIPTIFVRDPANPARLTSECNNACLWVFHGQGVATRKFDGTACLVRGGILYKRYDCKKGRTPPEGFEPCDDPDSVTGHWPGWLPVSYTDPADKWFRDASQPTQDGTYELIGPRIQGNNENREAHRFVPHGEVGIILPHGDITLEGMGRFLADHCIEGIVWHHPDGRMAKIKRRDFGLPWPVKP